MSSCHWFPLDRSEILAWVEQHRDTLPTTLDELARYPVAFRRVIVNCVSSEQRTQLWQEHLRTFLAPDAGLIAEQRSFLEQVIPTLRAIFFSPSYEEMQRRMRPLEEGIAARFSRAQGAAMFGMIGPPEPPEGLPIPAGTRLTPIT
jgi:hypothetical protein